MFIASQIVGFFGFILVLIAMALKRRRGLLILKLLSTVFILLSYFFVGSLAGVLVASVSLARGLCAIFFTYNKSAALKKLSFYVLCALTVVLNIVFWQSGLNILAGIISLISIYCFFQTKIFFIRLISILTSLLEIVLNLIILNPVNIGIEIFTISSCIFGICKHDIVIFKAAKKTVKRKKFKKHKTSPVQHR